jgi:hypothetical protein
MVQKENQPTRERGWWEGEAMPYGIVGIIILVIIVLQFL